MIHTVAIVLLAVAIAVIAVFDPHPRADGTSASLWTKAAYVKVFVHALGGLAIAGMVRPLVATDLHVVIFAFLMGALYELVQYLNVRSRPRGIYTVSEAIAVGLGAVAFLLWFRIVALI